MNARATRTWSLAVLATLLAAPWTLGCKQQVLCPPLASCGGPRDPNGHSTLPLALDGKAQEWVLAPGHPSCTEDLYVPASDTRLVGGNLPSGMQPYPEPAVFDWCVLLSTGPGEGKTIQTHQPRFYYESGPIGTVSVRYDETGHFSAGITRTGTFTLDFPAYCVRGFGAVNGRPAGSDLNGPPVDVCKQLEVPIGESGLGEGSYRNTKCVVNPDDPVGQEGCLCTFDVTETGGPSGEYLLADDQTILHLPGTNFPQSATFCAQGDSLQLTGTEGAYLFDQRGVRTFDLVRACGADAECVSRFCAIPSGGTRGTCGSRP